MNYLLFNPLANNNQGDIAKDNAIKELKEKYEGEFSPISVINLNIDELLGKVSSDDKIFLVGGDGTINRFANSVYNKELKCDVILYKAGTGNDFLNDLKDKMDGNTIVLNPYLKKLPKVYVNGKDEGYYINGIGYGIDGQCCVVANKMKEEGKKKISYSSISIKLLFHGYKCPDAEVIVDGVSKKYHKVWLASGMNGRYYGGGMQISPAQDRLGDELSVALIHNSSKIKTLLMFPKIFKGTHTKYKKNVDIRSGKEIIVKFTIPTALQIDGEVIENVTEYRIIK